MTPAQEAACKAQEKLGFRYVRTMSNGMIQMEKKRGNSRETVHIDEDGSVN